MKRGYWIIAFFVICLCEFFFINIFFDEKPTKELATVIDFKGDEIEVRLDSGGRVFADDQCGEYLSFGDRVTVQLINRRYVVVSLEKGEN